MLGVEQTGLHLIQLVQRRLGLETLAGKDVLDVGCGGRFTQTIINHNVPIGSYTGIDVEPHLIRYLSAHIQDARFHYVHWPVYNAMYNPTGALSIRDTPLPVSGTFDIIWLFSVITHLVPDDTDALLGQLRKHVRDDGRLFFSAFLDDSIESFEDRVPEKPLLRAFYSERFLRSILHKNAWQVEQKHPAEYLIQNHFVCRPSSSASQPGTSTNVDQNE
jgi:2-polyprenyl-3-methyl-5-hydroxy-6-metoxy-1,4-benzoquinol methylase